MANETEIIIVKNTITLRDVTTHVEFISAHVDSIRFKRPDADNFVFYNAVPQINSGGSERLNILGIIDNPDGTQGGVSTFIYSNTLDPDTGLIFVSSDVMALWFKINTGFFFNPNPIEVTGGIEGLLTQDALIAIAEGKFPGKSIVVTRWSPPPQTGKVWPLSVDLRIKIFPCVPNHTL